MQGQDVFHKKKSSLIHMNSQIKFLILKSKRAQPLHRQSAMFRIIAANWKLLNKKKLLIGIFYRFWSSYQTDSKTGYSVGQRTDKRNIQGQVIQ